MATGDVVNTAARLQAAAPRSTASSTRPRTGRRRHHRVRDGRPVSAKGKSDPAQVWEALAPRARLGVDIAFRGATPLVGRQRGARTLRDALARARASGAPSSSRSSANRGSARAGLIYELWADGEHDPELYLLAPGPLLPYGEGVSF